MTETNQQTQSGVIFMIWAVLFFGIAHACVKWLPHIPFYQLAFMRQVIALVLCLIPLWQKGISPWGHNKKLLIARGIAGSLALTTYFYALQNMPLASAVAIQYLSPLLTLILAHYLLKEHTTAKQYWCFAVAFIGVLMVKGFDTRISGLALAASLFSVVLSAFAYNAVRALRRQDHELVVVFYFAFVSLPLMIGPTINNWVDPVGIDWVIIAAVGLCTWLAQVAMTISYNRSPASQVAIYNNFGIFIALGFGYFFFGETFGPWSLMGIILIFVSVVISSLKVASTQR